MGGRRGDPLAIKATAVAGDVRPSWRPKMESDELDSGEEARRARAAAYVNRSTG
jgi:hypothetical protein